MKRSMVTAPKDKPIEKKGKTDDAATAKTNDFAWVTCPNCKGQRWGYTAGKGFKRPNGPSMPSCLVCDNEGRLIICYGCKAIQQCRDLQCKGCHKTLQCAEHNWELLTTSALGKKEKVICTRCKVIKNLAPKGFCFLHGHDWQVASQGATCKSCGVKADLNDG